MSATATQSEIQVARDIMDADGVPISWGELDQALHDVRTIEQSADRLRGLGGLNSIADRIIAHTKSLRTWLAAHYG